MSLEDLEKIRVKLLTLAVVNVLQPVEKSLLAEQLKSRIDAEQLDNILSELIKERRVAKEKKRYRLTSRGMRSTTPGKGRILRDIHRMKYLARSTRQRGGT
jgi:hypothetical protein